MSDEDLRARIHDLDVTVWVGKSGLGPVVDELSDQVDDRELVKVKFLRTAKAGTTTEELADVLAEQTDSELIETRGNTAVYR